MLSRLNMHTHAHTRVRTHTISNISGVLVNMDFKLVIFKTEKPYCLMCIKNLNFIHIIRSLLRSLNP